MERSGKDTCWNERDAGGRAKTHRVEVVKGGHTTIPGVSIQGLMMVTKTQETKLEVSEVKVLRLLLGVIRKDGIRDEKIRGTNQVQWFVEMLNKAGAARQEEHKQGSWMVGVKGMLVIR